MQCSEQEDDASSDEEIHEAVDSILAEDERDKSARKRQLAEREAANVTKRRNPSAEFKRRQTGAEKSRRFSLRVMEAMRALERRTERRAECPVSNKSPATCEIVDYVDRKFRNDGDVEAQVRIALKRLACQGFVKCEGGDAYTLLAPFASQLGRAGKANLGLHSTAELTDCRRHRSGRDARSNRSTARCRGGCRRDQSCKQTEESSEIDLSIPSSVEEDIFRRRIERDIESLQHRCPPGETEAENATMELRKPAQAAGEPGRRNSELRIEACGDEDRRQGKCQLNRSVAGSPRKGISKRRGSNRRRHPQSRSRDRSGHGSSGVRGRRQGRLRARRRPRRGRATRGRRRGRGRRRWRGRRAPAGAEAAQRRPDSHGRGQGPGAEEVDTELQEGMRETSQRGRRQR
ncbi:uncharacterized protein LOC103317701 isoform X8 [Nasonia vitripennis]|uniref:Uncharacterized protein n=1 Tax=Nasonia vitripennis TaxID=7425 RepID=A0A7M7QTZ5_NASVI|nr:uncharacterized protein LOC103317701 isoform X8 [Nasonia vitripennis]